MLRRFAFVFGIVAELGLFILPGAAQVITLDEAVSKLAGTTSREWLAGDVTTWMGGSDASCTSGAIYRFYQDRKVHIQECIDRVTKISEKTWSIRQEGQLDILLTIGDKTYKLLLFSQPDGEHMILRFEQSDSKIAPIQDIEFVLSQD